MSRCCGECRWWEASHDSIKARAKKLGYCMWMANEPWPDSMPTKSGRPWNNFMKHTDGSMCYAFAPREPKV